MIFSISNDMTNGVGDSLESEIRNSSIATALESISVIEDVLTILFKADLSAGDTTILNNLISNHSGNDIGEEVIIKYQESLPEGGKRKTDRGFKFTVPAGTTYTYDYLVTNNLQIKGGVMYTDENNIADSVSLEIVDTGFIHAGEWYPSEYAEGVPWSAVLPSGVPLHMYVGNFPVSKDGITKFNNDSITVTPLNGLTIRTTYKSHGVADVICNVGIVAYT